jgi:hypothetical protein
MTTDELHRHARVKAHRMPSVVLRGRVRRIVALANEGRPLKSEPAQLVAAPPSWGCVKVRRGAGGAGCHSLAGEPGP